MSIRCPSCDEYSFLPDTLDTPDDQPSCACCGTPITGFSGHYKTCSRCRARYLSVYTSCRVCDNPDAPRPDLLQKGARAHYRYVRNGHSFFQPPQGWPDDQAYRFVQTSAELAEAAADIACCAPLAVDTETTGLDPFRTKLILLQVATPRDVYVFDLRNLDHREVADALRATFEDPRVTKILHNANFDYKFIRVHLGIRLRGMFDTMLTHSVLSAGTHLAGSLKALARLYLDLEITKDIRADFENVTNLTDEHFRYAARDVALLFPIFDFQWRRLEEDFVTSTAQMEFDAIAPLAEMELAGLLVNMEKWAGLIEEHRVQRDALEAEALTLLAGRSVESSLFGDTVVSIKVTSQKQVIDAFAKLGVAIEDTSEETLAKTNHPAAKKLLEFREHDKLVTSFGESFTSLVNPVTNRIHPDFQQYGAETGRLSCRNPNVQQIPAKFRECFIAPPGWKVVTCDYSQAELRILAQLSRDPGFCDAFRSGGDLHAITASKMFKVDLPQVSKVQRGQAKAINFGLAYGMGAGSLAIRIGVEKPEAEKLIDQYFKAYPKVEAWLNRAAQSALRFGHSVTPLGRKRYYDLPDAADPDYRTKKSSIERQGKNTPIQGANADMTKVALTRIHDRLASYDARIVNTVHDEIVIEVVAEQADAVAGVTVEEMRLAGAMFITEVPVEVGVVVSDTWAK